MMVSLWVVMEDVEVVVVVALISLRLSAGMCPKKPAPKEETAYNQVFYPESRCSLQCYSRDNAPSGTFRISTSAACLSSGRLQRGQPIATPRTPNELCWYCLSDSTDSLSAARAFTFKL